MIFTEAKLFFDHIVTDVPKQCSTKHLISSLLFNDCYFSANMDITENRPESSEHIEQGENNQFENVLQKEITTIPTNINATQANATEKLSSELNDIKQKYLSLRKGVKELQLEFNKVSKGVMNFYYLKGYRFGL